MALPDRSSSPTPKRIGEDDAQSKSLDLAQLCGGVPRPIACRDAIMNPSNGNNGKSRTQAEQDRLLAALRRGPIDSDTAGRVHAIANVSRRILELRAAGYKISSRMVWRVTQDGQRRMVALYTLEAA